MDEAILRKLIEQTSAETRQHFDKTAKEMREHVDQAATETRAHFDVVTEGLRHDIQQVAEGVLMNSERIDRVSDRVDILTDETRKGFAELGAKVTISYSELDRRLRTLEDVVTDLRTRLERLESPSTH
ncbi:MAG: hypothetical protein ACSLFQ_23170 [Thermoanaerobaculia bacterium]